MATNNTPWLPSISLISDGTNVSAEVVNPVFDQCIQNLNYLYNTILNLQNKSVLIATAQPISQLETNLLPGFQYVVSWGNNVNTGQQGLIRAISAFTNSYSTSFFTSANSSYAFGFTNTIYSNGTADVYLEGLINLSTPIDNSTYGFLDFVSPGVRETFRPGPYYLSQKNPGLVTANPSGVIVYIGYALNNTTFLLSPNTDNFSELFSNFQFTILGRPTNVPVLTGSTWTIPSSNLSRLGWVDVSSLPASYTIPAGAAFYYNIPSSFATDNADNGGTGSLTTAQEVQAQQLYGLLPPTPANFVNLTLNGIQQEYANNVNNNPIYVINEFGLFWMTRQNPYQPWSASLSSGWVPANWISNQGTFPPNIYLIFAKLNPNLSEALVTNLIAYPDGSVNNLNIVQQTSPQTNSPTESTGPLAIQFNLPFSANTTTTSSPLTVSNVSFSQTTGQLTLTTAPLVSTLTTPVNSGLTLTNDSNGNFVISLQGQGTTGQLDEIDEINANYEYLGLNSYLRLKYNTSVISGFAGKITLPSNFSSNVNLYIVMQLFGFSNVASTPQSAGYSFQYSVSTAGNVLSSISTFTTTSGAPALVTFPASYVANTVLSSQPTQFVIPAAVIAPNSVVNFKVLQQNPTSNFYNNDVGLLTAYWSLV